MFSLIITVISIALVATLAVASFYYGGGAYTDSAQQSRVNQILNEAEQVAAANTLYRTETLVPAQSVDDLIDGGYLNRAPSEQWGIGQGYIETPARPDDAMACEHLNLRMTGSAHVPSCGDVADHANRTICCTR